jgi:hypothetical protein
MVRFSRLGAADRSRSCRSRARLWARLRDHSNRLDFYDG